MLTGRLFPLGQARTEVTLQRTIRMDRIVHETVYIERSLVKVVFATRVTVDPCTCAINVKAVSN